MKINYKHTNFISKAIVKRMINIVIFARLLKHIMLNS